MMTESRLQSSPPEAASASPVPESGGLTGPGLSRWCARWVAAAPERPGVLAAAAQEPVTRAAIAAWLEARGAGLAADDEAGLKRLLREVRGLTLATLIERDRSGRADLAEVMAAMTALAELTVDAALTRLVPLLVARHGEPRGPDGALQNLLVVGMGKLGGGELNVSSDIDLIFLYGAEGETVAGPMAPNAAGGMSNHEFFTHLGRRLIAVLSESTADGFVFRVDMDLRPHGASGPLVMSLDALEEYFFTQGRDWERFAWIKARVVSRPVLGDADLVAADLATLEGLRRPFVYRRYLDFGAIAALRSLHGMIRAEVARLAAVRSAARQLNVKLGRGGIREIEFVAQQFQLIRGGRDAELRGYSTLAMLTVLARKNLLDAEVAARLATTYVFLRNVEHRLQYLDDAQTHRLPTDEADRERVARMAGCASAAVLEERLQTEQAWVANVFDEVFGARNGAEPNASGPTAPPCWNAQLEASGTDTGVLDALREYGYPEPGDARNRLRALWMNSRVRQMGAASRARLDALIPAAVRAALEGARASARNSATAVDPGVVLGRLLDLFEAIAGRAAYLALLAEFPQALERVTRLMAASHWTAQYLIRHPILLDELLDARTLFAAPDWAAVKARLDSELAEAAGDVERQMNALREVHHAQVFRLLAQDIEGRLTVEVLADHLSALADLVLQVTLDAVWAQLPNRHRERPAFAVIAYGKYGGKELGYASDLDVVFVYDADADPDERAPEVYARYVQRLNTWLSSRTTAGALFEIDTALRPDGASGMPVTSLAAYCKYQRESAWLWEHQALTRARFCAGDAALGAAFERERRAILALTRDHAKVREEIVAMRQKLHQAHPNTSGQFDLKHDAGGMIDIEFCVQYLVLAHSGAHPVLLDDLGNIALLRLAGEAGLIDAELARATGDAYRAFRKSQHALRLTDARYARVPATEFVEERAAVRRLWAGLFG